MTLDNEIRRRADSMLLFERDGLIHFGEWRRWWAEIDPKKASEMLAEWEKVSNGPELVSAIVGNAD